MFLLRAFLVALFSIIALFLLTKMIGNKQVSQMNMFDYVNGISIGSIAANLAVADKPKKFFIVLVAMVTYALFAFGISLMTIKSVKLRRILSGKPILLVEKGVIYRKNLLKARLDINDVLTLARSQGYFNLADIEYAIMENNGKVSFLQKAPSRPATCADMNIMTQPDSLVCNVIIDGKLMPQNLRHSGKDNIWLDKQLHAQGYNNYKDIMLATVDGNNNLSVYKSIDKENKSNIFD